MQITAEETKVDPITQGFQVGRRENRRKETEEKPSVKGRQRKRSQHWGLSFVGTKSGKKGNSEVRGGKYQEESGQQGTCRRHQGR